jgi:hypothetical protein
MWAGREFQQDWLHVTLGIAPYDPQYLVYPDLLEENLVNPAEYFGIQLDPGAGYVRPVVCSNK